MRPKENFEHFSFQEKSAEKMPSLIDGYLKFDPDFFRGENFDASPEEWQKQRDEFAKRYSHLLQDETLKQITDGSKPVAELPKEVVRELRDLISHEEKHSSLLSKKVDEKKLFQATNFEGPYSDYIIGKTPRHLFRLLFPREYMLEISPYKKELMDKAKNSVCGTFAKEYLSYIAKLNIENREEIDQVRKVQEIIGAEGSDTLLFWTLAPYIHDELKLLGNSADQSIEKIMQWAKDAGAKAFKRGNQGFGDFDYVDFRKFGLSGFPQDYVLGLDERMPSHLLSRLLAKKVAESLNEEK